VRQPAHVSIVHNAPPNQKTLCKDAPMLVLRPSPETIKKERKTPQAPAHRPQGIRKVEKQWTIVFSEVMATNNAVVKSLL
jgi:hypothetical protein